MAAAAAAPAWRRWRRLLLASEAGTGGRPGDGLEPSGVRPYQPGDDLRRLDARAQARLDQPMVRQRCQPVALTVQLLLDGSASMGALPAVGRRPPGGEGPPLNKASLARHVAWALGSAALAAGHRVGLWGVGPAVPPPLPVASGHQQQRRLVAWLGAWAPAGEADWPQALAAAARRWRCRSWVALVGDWTWPQAPQLAPMLGRLGSAGHRLWAAQVLSLQESAGGPAAHAGGGWRDAEGDGQLFLPARAQARWPGHLAAHQARLVGAWRQAGVAVTRLVADPAGQGWPPQLWREAAAGRRPT